MDVETGDSSSCCSSSTADFSSIFLVLLEKMQDQSLCGDIIEWSGCEFCPCSMNTSTRPWNRKRYTEGDTREIIFTWMSLALPVSVKKIWSVEEVNWLWLQSRSKTDAPRGVSRPAGCLTATICNGIVCSMAVFIWGITRMFEAFRSPCINHKWRSKGL